MPTEQQVHAAAEIIAASPLIDAPKLAVECWHGLARQILEAAEKSPAPLARSRRDDWHYDSQGYCDNPGRGY